MPLEIKKATKKQKFLRLSIAGQTGSGKTLGALKIAFGLLSDKFEKKVLVFDTENGRASLKSDIYDFDVIEFDFRSQGRRVQPQDYIDAIKAAEDNGYDILIMDSVTPEWEAVLELQNKMQGQNSFANWGKVKQQYHQPFIDAILYSKIHIISTIRSKMDYTTDKDPNTGKTSVKAIGLGGQQDSNLEYFMDVAIALQDRLHNCEVVKMEGTEKYETLRKYTYAPFVITEKLGADLYQWLTDGVDPELERYRNKINSLLAEYESESGEKHDKAGVPLTSLSKEELTVIGQALRADLEKIKEAVNF